MICCPLKSGFHLDGLRARHRVCLQLAVELINLCGCLLIYDLIARESCSFLRLRWLGAHAQREPLLDPIRDGLSACKG